MQISGANLLLASQQAVSASAAHAPGFAAALQKTSSFTPPDLTAPEPVAQPQTQTRTEAARPPSSGPMRPGMHVDLKV